MCKAKSGPCKNRPDEGAGPSQVEETIRSNREEVKVRLRITYCIKCGNLYGYFQALVQSLDGDQQQSLLIELLQDRGGVELARCMMQRRDNNDDYQPPQGTPEWEMQILSNGYAVRCVHASPQLMYSTTPA